MSDGLSAKDAYRQQVQATSAYMEGDGFRLGPIYSRAFLHDPRQILFVLSRYKFVAKMFKGLGAVLEVGAGEGLGILLVLQEVGSVVAVDFRPEFIESAKDRFTSENVEFQLHDILREPVRGRFDGAYSLDVLEHIEQAAEHAFMSNLTASLNPLGICIIGMPSLESQRYASPNSKIGHVNCKSGENLEALMRAYFRTVLMFAMNDEVVHTGFLPMAHYLLAVGIQPVR
jgi:2-polyprenyl-3-methyl-5-hydroxy-6-metoxy-1,4-benzoquinol methylase